MAKGCKKCDPHEICEECPEWIFTLADLIMCMMGLFVILWVLKPGGELILVNHIGAENGPRRVFELAFSPLARRLGWRPEFPWARLVDWAAKHGGVSLTERRPMPPMGHFSLIRYRKA